MNEQIEILDKALANLRVNYAENAWHLFLWGFLVLAGLVFNYMLVVYLQRPELVNRSWLVLIMAGSAVEIVRGVRSKPTGRSVTHLEKSIGVLWGLLGVSMLTIAFIAPRVGLISYSALMPLLMLQIWVGALFTGIMIKFRPLAWLSNVWLLALTVILFVPGAASGLNQMLLMAGCLVVGYLVPGFLLRAEST